MEQQDLSAHLRVEQLQDTLFFPPTDCMAMTTGKKAFRQAQQNGPRNYLYVVAQFQSAELLWLEYLDFLDAVRNAILIDNLDARLIAIGDRLQQTFAVIAIQHPNSTHPRSDLSTSVDICQIQLIKKVIGSGRW